MTYLQGARNFTINGGTFGSNQQTYFYDFSQHTTNYVDYGQLELEKKLASILSIIEKHKEHGGLDAQRRRIDDFCHTISVQLRAIQTQMTEATVDAGEIAKAFRTMSALCDAFWVDIDQTVGSINENANLILQRPNCAIPTITSNAKLDTYESKSNLPSWSRYTDISLERTVSRGTSIAHNGVCVVVHEAKLNSVTGVIVRSFEGRDSGAVLKVFTSELEAHKRLWSPYFLQMMGKLHDGEWPPSIIYRCPDIRSSMPLQQTWNHLLHARDVRQAEELVKQLFEIVIVLRDHTSNCQRKQAALIEDKLVEGLQLVVIPSQEDTSQYRLLFTGEVCIARSQLNETLDMMGLGRFRDVDARLGSIRDFTEQADRNRRHPHFSQQADQSHQYFLKQVGWNRGQSRLTERAFHSDCYWGWSPEALMTSVHRRAADLEMQLKADSGSPLVQWLQDSRRGILWDLPTPLSRLYKLLGEIKDMVP